MWKYRCDKVRSRRHDFSSSTKVSPKTLKSLVNCQPSSQQDVRAQIPADVFSSSSATDKVV